MDFTALNIAGASPNMIIPVDPAGYKVDLYIQCRKLKDLDVFSKSDPQVRISLKDSPAAATWKKIGETEVIENNLNPDFKTTVQVMYLFEVNQQIRFEVVDSDGGKSAELIGNADTSVGTMVGSKDFTYTANIYKPGDKNVRGQITVRVVPIKQSTAEIIMKLGARNLPMNTTCFCISSINPYIVIDKTFKTGGKTNYVTVAKTEVSDSGTPSPSFKVQKFKA